MAKTRLGRKRSGLNKLGHHVLRENHAGLLRSHTGCEKPVLGLEGADHGLLKKLAGLILVGPIHLVDLITPLLLVGRTGTELRGAVKRGRTIHISPAHLIASKADRMTKPLTSQEDRHLDTKASLRVKKRRHVVVLEELRNELFVSGSHLLALLGKADTSGIHDGEIIAKRLQKFDGAGLKDRHVVLYGSNK